MVDRQESHPCGTLVFFRGNEFGQIVGMFSTLQDALRHLRATGDVVTDHHVSKFGQFVHIEGRYGLYEYHT